VPEPDRAPSWLNAAELIRQAAAESAAEIALYGFELPSLADEAALIYTLFREGNEALDAGDYTHARRCLQQVVTAGIEEARPQLAEAIAGEQLQAGAPEED